MGKILSLFQRKFKGNLSLFFIHIAIDHRFPRGLSSRESWPPQHYAPSFRRLAAPLWPEAQRPWFTRHTRQHTWQWEEATHPRSNRATVLLLTGASLQLW